MVPFRRQVLLPMLALASAASAQTPPAGPAQAASAATFRSALDGYRRFDDARPIPWRAANDTVGRIGGWRQYARQAQAPAAGASAPPHAGHGRP